MFFNFPAKERMEVDIEGRRVEGKGGGGEGCGRVNQYASLHWLLLVAAEARLLLQF